MSTTSIAAETGIDIRAIRISDMRANAYNPNEMEAEFFEHLVDAVREEGMNQPVLVREDPDHPGKFLVIDGEHRFRAAQVVASRRSRQSVVPFDETKSKIRTLSFNAIKAKTSRSSWRASSRTSAGLHRRPDRGDDRYQEGRAGHRPEVRNF